MMMTEITKPHRNLLVITAVMTFLLVILGGIVCMTESSQGCPDWPGCYGELLPPLRSDALIEFTHRLTAAVTAVLVLMSAIVGFWKYRNIHWISRPPVIALLLLIAVGAFGAATVLYGLSTPLAAMDLGFALLVLALMTTGGVWAMVRYKDPTIPDKLLFKDAFSRLSLTTLVLTFITLVFGVLVADGGSIIRCLGWPLFENEFIPDSTSAWLVGVRDALAFTATIFILVLYIRARNLHTRIRRAAFTVFLATLMEIGIGLLLINLNYALPFLLLYVIFATILWTSLVVLTVLAGMVSIKDTPSA